MAAVDDGPQLCFSIWCSVGKTAAATVAALEALAGNQYTLTKDGGRLLIRPARAAKVFLAPMADMTPATVAEMALQAYIQIREYTDAQLEAWLVKPQVRTTIAAFNHPLGFN